MSWNALAIIIHKPTQIDNIELLEEFGFQNLKEIKDRIFQVAMEPYINTIYIGSYQNNLLICETDLPKQFFKDIETQTEFILERIFPNSEICSIVIDSSVNLWGYSLIKNGRKIRAKAGSAKKGIFVEFGELLEEEKELIGKSKVNKDGQRIYFVPGIDYEPNTENEFGINFVFAVCRRYFGKELDHADELLYETKLKGYSFENYKFKEAAKSSTLEPMENKKVWWKFW